ncbi:MAG: flagellar basal body rod C-terminal domain-containing protein, partial [Anaerolineaceae bacterium]|nr:flagellar basal body rod C-terminal domain-containing protein [Anaerolineaceae bacterium]
MVSINGHSLVTGHSSTPLDDSVRDGAGAFRLQWAGEPVQAFVPANGELAGFVAARQEIASQQSGLETLAGALYHRVNQQHSAGRGLTSTQSLPFFTTNDGSTAPNPTNLQVNSDLVKDVTLIAAASAPGAPGDGSNAQALADVRSELLLGGNTITANQFYNQQVTRFGLTVRRAIASAKDMGLSRDALATQRESISGVNLDEEAANLMKAQKAYQAAVRVMNVMDELLDRVINQMGLAGR